MPDHPSPLKRALPPPRATVRFACPSDAGELARLRWRSRSPDEQQREDCARFTQRFVAWFGAADTARAWHVAVAEGSDAGLVGCMYLRVVETVPVPGAPARAWGYVTHAFVIETERGNGVGRALLAHLVARGRELDLKELQVWPSNRAVSLYVRAGFLSPETLRSGRDPEEASYVLPLAEGAPSSPHARISRTRAECR